MIRKTSVFLSAVLLFLGSLSAFGQLDPGFGVGGVATTDVNNEDRPIGGFLLPDGKIFVVNEGFNTIVRYSFLRYNSDGTPDATYGTGGKVELSGLFISPSGIYGLNRAVRQTDGKIILVGTDNFSGLVARFNEDGTLDTSFIGNGIHRPNISMGNQELDVVTSVALQNDGKIVIAGSTSPNGVPTKSFLLRYLPNGSLDKTFGNEGFIVHGFPPSANQLHLQSTGKIITSSASARFLGASSGVIRRYNADGTYDASFPEIAFSDASLRASLVLPDDRILIAEKIDRTDALEREHGDVRVTRYDANGAVDSTFGTLGRTMFDLTSSYMDDSPNALTIMPDGQIIVSVITLVSANRTVLKGPMLSMARLTANGTLNGKFLEVNALFFDDAFLATYPDGRILTVFRTVNSGNINILLARVTGVPLQNYKFRGKLFDFAHPVPDGFADPTIFRPSDSKWCVFPSGVGYSFGLPTDILVPSDYIKDTGADRAVFRPDNGTWYIARNYFEPNNFISIRWGLSGDIPAVADYDGDLKSDVAVFRPSDGVWYINKSSGGSPIIFRWGLNGDKPVPGDYDGDTIDDIAVFRPSDGNWYILKSSDGQPLFIHFGSNGDVPVQDDYDGDGKADIAVWRPSTATWYRLDSSSGSFFAFNWGLTTDVAVPADYDGDSKADIAVFRASNGRWYVYQSSTNTMGIFNWGLSTDVPVQRRY